jgi:AcrR family transcriptional regulator
MTVVRNEDFQKKFRYHHGHLRESLLAAALEILGREGTASLSLRQLAKATGVSQAAPYTYFNDKDELLAAVAQTGFEQLRLQIFENVKTATTVQQKVEQLMTSYINFAIERRPLFQLMFGRELSDLKKHPTLAGTHGKFFAQISGYLKGRREGAEDANFLTVTLWGLCQGLASLLSENKLKTTDVGAASVEEFVKRTVALLAAQLS